MIWIGSSWKMTKTIAEAVDFVDHLITSPVPDGVQAFLLPAHTALAAVRDRLVGHPEILLGAQNAHWSTEGAGTGEISMRMAADAGARLIEIGHSERRGQFGESDESVARKIAAATAYGLTPLLCVGESSAVREAGEAESFVQAQLSAALDRIDAAQVRSVLVAYEPVWAIGERGRPATPAEVTPVLNAIRDAVPTAQAVLYGGSVDLDNAPDLLEHTGADGLFVGRAAWSATQFSALLRIGASFADPERPAPQLAPAQLVMNRSA